uniref:Putative group i salivary lipocalin n=1 Tax=Rhipicephalus pulchellus TaxID=72859 RepID=L7LT65_RHIPC
MRSWLVLSALLLATSVSALAQSNDIYDYYDSQEETTPARETRRKRSKKVSETPVYDISEFYDTKEKIWVYNTTKKANETCTVDDIEETSLINVIMTRYYFSDGTIKNQSIEAKFAVHPQIAHITNTYNEMQIPTPGFGSPFETLMYMSDKKDCGVFYVNYHGNELRGPYDWFELRIRNSSLEKGPDKACLDLFTEITASQRKTFNYTSACQCIMRLRT